MQSAILNKGLFRSANLDFILTQEFEAYEIVEMFVTSTITQDLTIQNFPTTTTIESTNECQINDDCEDTSRICHENKCICMREKPVEANGTCLTRK